VSDIERVRRKLESVQALEGTQANWSGISYAMRPPIEPMKLAQLERQHGIELPDDYRAFLLEIGNGGAGPGYGLYGLEAALEERGPGVWGLSDPFIPPASTADWIDVRAPGMLLIHYNGCAYYDGLVVTGPARGTTWSYVEVAPGWVPMVRGELVDADGKPFELQGDYQAWYDVMLLEVNRPRRTSFLEWYEAWLDSVIRANRPKSEA